MATIEEHLTAITTETEQIIETEIVTETEGASTKEGKLIHLDEHFDDTSISNRCCFIPFYLIFINSRYPPMGYPNHYISHNAPYYPAEAGPANANSGNAAAYRYPPGSSSDWGRERDFEYRRDYDRRAPPPSGTS